MIDNGFDKIAFCYDFLALCVFGRAQRKAQIYFLDCIPSNANILIIGGGSGWLLKKVLAKKNPRHVTYIEASQKMLERSQKKAGKVSSKVTFILGDECSVSLEPVYDAIFTCFFLDIFTEERVNSIIYKLYNSLTLKGFWVQVDFDNYFIANNFLKKSLVRLMYIFFSTICRIQGKALPDTKSIFNSLNVVELKHHYSYFSMIKASLYSKATF